MLTLPTLTGGTLQLLDSIHAISAKRYTLFNIALLDHSAVGSDLHAATQHLGRLKLFLEGKEVDSALEAFNNYLLCLNQARHTAPDALAILLHSIDGELVAAPADDDYTALGTRLADLLTQQQVEEALAEVRGKWMRP